MKNIKGKIIKLRRIINRQLYATSAGTGTASINLFKTAATKMGLNKVTSVQGIISIATESGHKEEVTRRITDEFLNAKAKDIQKMLKGFDMWARDLGKWKVISLKNNVVVYCRIIFCFLCL